MVRHFFYFGTLCFFKLLGVFENVFFQLFGHFMSTHVWVDVECPNFFWSDIFLFWDSVFFQTFEDIWDFFSSSYLGISCLLIFEWMRNALIFFGLTFFYFGTLYFSQMLADIWDIFSSSCLGISCLLMFEWMWNALIFFLVRHFSI